MPIQGFSSRHLPTVRAVVGLMFTTFRLEMEMEYNVTIETSVTVDADTPEEAANIAYDWAEESLSDSNAIVKVNDEVINLGRG